MKRRLVLAIGLLAAILTHPLLAASADVSVSGSFSGSVRAYDLAERFTFGATLRSAGPDAALDPRLTITLPEGAVIIELKQPSISSCVQQGRMLTCTWETLASGGTFSVGVIAQAPADPSGGIYTIETRGESATPDPALENNTVAYSFAVRRAFEVTTTADDGPGSLRQQIHSMNATCGGEVPCKITFAEPMLIEPLTPLPTITVCNSSIDGGGVTGTSMRVELSGVRTLSGNGLAVHTNCTGNATPGVTIRRLAIGSFPENGVAITTAGARAKKTVYELAAVQHEISECFIGTDPNGTIARPNALRGVATAAPDADVLLFLDTIAGNRRSGAAFWAVGLAELLHSRIGIAANDAPLPNGASGVFVASGIVRLSDTEVAYNAEYGVAASPDAVYIDGWKNTIHDNTDMQVDLGLDGPSPAVDLRPPALVDAFYDALNNRTVVRGRLGGFNRSNVGGGVFNIAVSVATPPNDRGYPGLGTMLIAAESSVIRPPFGQFDRDFEMTFAGDLRSKTLISRTSYSTWPDGLAEATSELSNIVVVH